MTRYFTFFLLLCFANPLFAQTETDLISQMQGWEAGFHFGRLLPNQIDNVTEIVPMWGVRGGYTHNSSTYEAGFSSGRGEGVDWKTLSVSLRGNIPVEDIIGLVYLGGDLVQFTNTSGNTKTQGSGHVGGGIIMQVAPSLWFRGDMKFNVNPGTSMYIGFGFTFSLSNETKT